MKSRKSTKKFCKIFFCFIMVLIAVLAIRFSKELSFACSNCAVYGCWCSVQPAWLDQSLTSNNGDFILLFSDDTHHNAAFVGDPDTDGDGLPDSWETNFFGNLASNQNNDNDGDGANNLQEFQAGSWPNESLFRPGDTVPSATDAGGDNLVIKDNIDTLLFCQDKYDQWGFNPPWGLPLSVFVRWGDGGGWGNVNPLWIAPAIINDLTDPDRRCVAIHELFHNVQRAYPNTPGNTDWFTEGSARMVQDMFYLDSDIDDGSMYAGEIAGFLGNPESVGLFERSYRAVFFFKYLCEQTGKTIVGQPWEGMDAMHRFMVSSNGLEGEVSMQQYLDDLEPGDYWDNRDFSHFFGAWVTALYTRQFDPSSLSTLYYYQDEQENLPTSLLRPVNISNCPYSAATDSYTPENVPLNGHVYHDDANTATWNQNLGNWRSRYFAFEPDNRAKFVIVWADGKTGQSNYYSIVGVKGNDVENLYFNYGEDLQKALYNAPLDEVGVVVAALDEAADFDVMIWTVSDFWLNITYPLNDDKEIIKTPEAGITTTFEVHVEVTTEKTESPDEDIYVNGLSPDLFEVTVNGVDAPVMYGYEMMNEYWLTCAAPDLGPGEYDLEVKLISESDLEIKAIQYADIPHVDKMIVIDRSGSMGSALMGNNEKMLAAKSGGRLHTDLMVDDDQLGLVSFGSAATLHEALDTVDAAHKNQVKDAINNDITDDPVSTEHTAMGPGILEGYNQLTGGGDAGHDWHIVLLTDGIEDVAPYWDDALVSGVVIPSKVQIDTIALGSGAHESLLRRVAEETDGRYFHVAIPTSPTSSGALKPAPGAGIDSVIQNKVADIYRMIIEEERNYARIWSEEGTADSGGKTVTFDVYEGMQNLLLTVNWPLGSEVSIELFNPSAVTQPPVVEDITHVIYELPVITGEWRLEISAYRTTPYLAILSGQGHLHSNLFFRQPDHSDKIGAVQKICFSLFNKTEPMAGSEVVATVTTPSDETSRLQLCDDGNHGDENANDGIYSRDYRLTPWVGSYHVGVIAEGKDGDVSYRIEENGFFVMEADSDRDKDGMPDEWEQRYGLQPDEYDAGQDKDSDDVVNLDEFEHGGHPSDEDTDNGGTQDGSELLNGMDMLEFSDDLIAPPSSFITNKQVTDAIDPDYQTPQSGENLLYWSIGENYATVDIYRSLSESSGYALIASDVPASTKPYTDDGLTNDKSYYYKIRAKTATGVLSRLSKYVLGVPKVDNVRPLGSIVITGDKTITTLNVVLKLWVSEEPAQMRFSNTGDFDGSSWEVFSQDKNWTIAGKEGANFVYVQYMDDSGNISLPYFDSVFYKPGAVSTTTTADSTTTTSSFSSTTTTAFCLSGSIYGENSEEAALLRYIRDNVLRQTPAGQEIIRLYYQLSPAIVKAMEEDNKFKEEIQELIDGIFLLIGEEVE